MPTDRQGTLLAALRARGPAHPADLAYHPTMRDRYGPTLRRFDIEDDLEALVDSGEVVAYLDDVSGEISPVAYDVVDVKRPNWQKRYDRAVRVQREQLKRERRKSRI